MNTEVIKIRMTSPEDTVVVNGESWKCPVYSRRMPPCRNNCPTSEDIRGYLTNLVRAKNRKVSNEEAFDEAWYLLTDKNPFPAVHGRICPHPCEKGCNRAHKDSPVAINSFERVVGDHGIARGLRLKKITDKKRDRKVAVVGSGPSGLSCAYQLARRGYPVTVFETAEKPGGMLRYGIASYRLPREVLDAEINNILALGVELKCNTRIGADVPFQKLRDDYDAIYLAIGAQKGGSLNIPGENLARVVRGVDFLGRLNRGEKFGVVKNAVIIGGGNTAVDAARVCRRLGAAVTLLYRRTRNEMPAVEEEIQAAEQEGVSFRYLAAPVSIEDTDRGKGPARIRCVTMTLGEKDKSGRARPVPVEGSDFYIDAEMVVSAIGQETDLTGMDDIPNTSGWVRTDAVRETPIPGIFAGGDAVALDLAVTAVGHGRKAARAIEGYLRGVKYREPRIPKPVLHTEMKLDYYPEIPRNNPDSVPVEERIGGFQEVNRGLTMEAAAEEAKRCMSCGLCFECDICRVYCPREAVSRDKKRPVGKVMFTDYTRCNGCHICAESCPCGYIEMGMGL